MRFGQGLGGHQILVKKAILLQPNSTSLLLWQAHAFGNLHPRVTLFFGNITLEALDQRSGITQAPRCQVIGVPVVVDVVLVLIGSRHAKHDVGTTVLRPVHALRPKARHRHGHIHPFFSQVGVVSRVLGVIAEREDHGPIPMDFFEGDFPLVVAFLAIHGHHGIQRRSVLEAQFLGILNGLAELVETVTQELLGDVRRVSRQVKRQTIRLCVPIRGPAVFLARESLGAHIQSGIVSAVGLVEVKDVEANGLLRFDVSFDLDVAQRPNRLPCLDMCGAHGLVAPIPSRRGLCKCFFTTTVCCRVKGADEAHKLGHLYGRRVVPRRSQPSPLLSLLDAPSRIRA